MVSLWSRFPFSGRSDGDELEPLARSRGNSSRTAAARSENYAVEDDEEDRQRSRSGLALPRRSGFMWSQPSQPTPLQVSGAIPQSSSGASNGRWGSQHSSAADDRLRAPESTRSSFASLDALPLFFGIGGGNSIHRTEEVDVSRPLGRCGDAVMGDSLGQVMASWSASFPRYFMGRGTQGAGSSTVMMIHSTFPC